MQTKTPSAVVLSGVTKRYGNVVAVKPLDFTIEAGTLVTLLGPSGCGKTTLLRMIAGLEEVSGGTISIGGRDVTRMSAGERNVSMVFQSYALFPHMNARENVAYGLISSGTAKRQAHAEAEAALVTVGLANFGDRLPSEMSGGQQQRVAVARALVLNPDVLLFDEPLSNLDAKLRRSMREEIRSLQQRLGVTVVYVTHDQSEALAVSDKIVVMRNAEIAQAGTPQELFEEPGSLFVANFMGEANQVKAELSERVGKLARVAVGDIVLELAHRDLAAGPVNLIVRPEAIRIGEAGAIGTMASVVKRSTYMGAHNEYLLETPAGILFAIVVEKGALREVGQKVGVGFADKGVFVVGDDAP